MVIEARRHPRGFGLLEEADLLAGKYSFPELEKLQEADRATLLDAAARLFVRQTLCFRESVNDRAVLIFPLEFWGEFGAYPRPCSGITKVLTQSAGL